MSQSPVGNEVETLGALAGRYRVIGWLGAGSHADVLLAHDERLDRAVAIKRVRNVGTGSNASLAALHESRVQAQLSHANIVGLFDVIEDSGVVHLVSEFVDGATLAELRSGGPIHTLRALEILIDVAQALDHAHRRGVIHSDVKLENVLVSREGAAKLADFGVARIVREATAATSARTLKATAPEVLRGGEPDVRSDLFAFGVLAFEAITGTHRVVEAAHDGYPATAPHGAHGALREWVPEAPDALARLVDRLLDANPDLRPQNAAEVAVELASIADRWRVRGDAPQEGRAGPSRLRVAIAHFSFSPLGVARGHEMDVEGIFASHQTVARLAAEFGGERITAAGSESVIVFGLSTPTEEDCEHAAALVARVLEASRGRRHLPDLMVRAAIGVGDVWRASTPGEPLVGAALDEVRMLAAGLGGGECVATTAARSRLASRYQLVPRIVGGGAEPSTGLDAGVRLAGLACYEIVGSTRPQSDQQRHPTPLIGRDSVVSAICRHLDPAVHGQPRVVIVAGEPGIGKTRVVDEVLRIVGSDDAPALPIAAGRPETRFTPFAALRPLVRGLLGLPETLREDVDAAGLIASALGAAPAVDAAASLAIAAGVAGEAQRARVRSLFQRERQDAVFQDVVALLSTSGSVTSGGRLFVVEDLQWFDRSSRNVIEELIRRPPPNLRLLLTSRLTDELSAAGDHVQTFELPRLALDDARRLLGTLAPGDGREPMDSNRLLAAADGLPILIEELGRPTTNPAAALSLSLGDRVAATLRELGGPARHALKMLAVLGASGPDAGSEGGSELGIDPRYFSALETRGLLQRQPRDHGRHSFTHPLVRDEVLASIPADERAALHLAVVAAFDTGRRNSTARAEIAHHCAGAGLTERAIREWRAAGNEASLDGAHSTAAQHFDEALALVPAISDTSLRPTVETTVRDERGVVLARLHGWASAAVATNSAAVAALRAAASGARAPFGLWLAFAMGYAGGDMRSANNGIADLEHQARLAGAAPIWRYLAECARGIILLHLGRLPQCRAAFEVAIQLRTELSDELLAFPMPEAMIAPNTYLAWERLLVGQAQAADDLQRQAESGDMFHVSHHIAATSMGMPLAQAARDHRAATTRARRVLDVGGELALPHRASAEAVLAVASIRDRTIEPQDLASVVETIWRALAPYQYCADEPERPRMRAGYVVTLVAAADACRGLAAGPEINGAAREKALAEGRRFLEAALFEVEACDSAIHRYFAAEIFRCAAAYALDAGDRPGADAYLVEARRRADYVDGEGAGGAWLLLDRIAEVGASW